MATAAGWNQVPSSATSTSASTFADSFQPLRLHPYFATANVARRLFGFRLYCLVNLIPPILLLLFTYQWFVIPFMVAPVFGIYGIRFMLKPVLIAFCGLKVLESGFYLSFVFVDLGQLPLTGLLIIALLILYQKLGIFLACKICEDINKARKLTTTSESGESNTFDSTQQTINMVPMDTVPTAPSTIQPISMQQMQQMNMQPMNMQQMQQMNMQPMNMQPMNMQQMYHDPRFQFGVPPGYGPQAYGLPPQGYMSPYGMPVYGMQANGAVPTAAPMSAYPSVNAL